MSTHLVQLQSFPGGISPMLASRCLELAQEGAAGANRPTIERLHEYGLIEAVPERPRPGRPWTPRLTDRGRAVAHEYDHYLRARQLRPPTTPRRARRSVARPDAPRSWPEDRTAGVMVEEIREYGAWLERELERVRAAITAMETDRADAS